MTPPGRNLSQWLQNEAAQMQPWVRQNQRRRIDMLRIIVEQIEIKGTRGVRRAANSPERCLQG